MTGLSKPFMSVILRLKIMTSQPLYRLSLVTGSRLCYLQLCFNLNFPQMDLESLDPRGRTPLHLAVTLGHLDCARVLLQQGADVNKENLNGWTGECVHASYSTHSSDEAFIHPIMTGRHVWNVLEQCCEEQLPSAGGDGPTLASHPSRSHVGAAERNMKGVQIIFVFEHGTIFGSSKRWHVSPDVA